MKILDKYLLKTFLITFTTVFVILFFIFVLQVVWLFISELAGKDLDIFMIIKFLLFKMPSIIPLVLPLSVLLASIMTFGSFSENYEFAAMKSAGISFQRAMRSSTVFILILSILAFVFANNVIPYAEFKFINFRRNIAQVKPAMAIVEGQFSEIGSYSIKVDKKSGENGNSLTGIIIHIKSPTGEGNRTVIKAKRGELISNEYSNILKLVLFDGNYYEDIIPKLYEEKNRLPFAKATFKKDIINIDLSKLNTNIETGEIANTNSMLNLIELNYTIDSLNTNYNKDIQSFTENVYQRISLNNGIAIYNKTDSLINTKPKFTKNLLENLSQSEKIQTLIQAKTNIEATLLSIESSKYELEEKQKNINSHWISFHDKFVVSFACLLMFFIGAPLGSIIRKGGIGLPIVFAVSIFIVFHFINTFGKKVAQESGISPLLGTWMASVLLTPLAVSLTYRATNDIGGNLSFDVILDPFKKILNKFGVYNPIIQPKIDAVEKEIVIDINKLKIAIESYNSMLKITLPLYVLSFIAALILNNNRSYVFVALFAICVLLFYYSLYKSQQKVNAIEIILGRKIEPGFALVLLIGFPFYLFIYFYNNMVLRKVLVEEKS